MQWIDFQQTLNQRLSKESLDDEQSKKFKINGHSLVRGAAGSGKSLVLRNRVEKIVEEKLNPVLVLSYNRFMKEWIQSTLAKKGLKAECKTFHQWSYQKIGYNYKYDRDDALRLKVIGLARNSNVINSAIK